MRHPEVRLELQLVAPECSGLFLLKAWEWEVREAVFGKPSLDSIKESV